MVKFKMEYIITSEERMIKKYLPFNFFIYGEYFSCFKSKKALIAYCQSNPCDWVNMITGPNNFYHVSEKFYYRMLELLQEGKYVTYSQIYKWTYHPKRTSRTNKFVYMINRQGGTIDMRKEK